MQPWILFDAVLLHTFSKMIPASFVEKSSAKCTLLVILFRVIAPYPRQPTIKQWTNWEWVSYRRKDTEDSWTTCGPLEILIKRVNSSNSPNDTILNGIHHFSYSRASSKVGQAKKIMALPFHHCYMAKINTTTLALAGNVLPKGLSKVTYRVWKSYTIKTFEIAVTANPCTHFTSSIGGTITFIHHSSINPSGKSAFTSPVLGNIQGSYAYFSTV